MNKGTAMTTAHLESAVASAWRATIRAALIAESRLDQSTADDLHQLCAELRRIQEDLLRGKGRRGPSKLDRAYLYPSLIDADPPAS